MVTKKEWVNWKNRSRKLRNTGKRFDLKLAVDTMRDVCKQLDSDRVLYDLMAMIRCGLAWILNAVWELKQLFPHLQNIIRKFKENFVGKNMGDSLGLDQRHRK